MTELPKLLPTPAAWDGSRGLDLAREERSKRPPTEDGKRQDSGGDDLLTGVVKLLPTPMRADGERQSLQGPRAYSEQGGDNPTLLGAAVRLLPTPTSSDQFNSRRDTARHDHWESKPGRTLLDAALLSSGQSTSPPSEGGRLSSAGLVLSPSFDEWMMGAPAGWSSPDCPLSVTEFTSMLRRQSEK